MGNRALWTTAVTPHSYSEARPFSSSGLYYGDIMRLTAIAEFPELLGAEIDQCIQPHRTATGRGGPPYDHRPGASMVYQKSGHSFPEASTMMIPCS